MAESQVHFAVHIMPPKRPANSLSPIRRPQSDEPLRILAVGAKVTEKFQDVWRKIEKQYEAGYTPEERAAFYFSRMQTSMRADIMLSDSVGTLYHERTPRDERVLFVQTVAIDRGCSIADTSGLRPAGFKRPRIEDLSPDLRDSVKRRRLQQIRYGATVDELDPNVPLVSRELQSLDGEEGGDEEEPAEQRRDEDGFAIPRKVNRRPLRQNAQPEEQSPATVLVKDSQAQHEAAQPLAALETLRRRTQQPASSRPHSVHSTPLDHSSPAESAAARAETTVPQAGAMRAARQTRKPTSAVKRTSTNSHAKQETLPTPESRERRRSSNEAPTRAPRSPSSRASVSERSRRFIRRPAAPAPKQDLAVSEQDPIEDGDEPLLNGVDDDTFNGIEDDVLPEPPEYEAESLRGRERSRSIDSAEQTLRSRSTRDATDHIPDAASNSVFDELTSSQAALAARNRSTSAKKVWSAREDKLLLRGIRKSYSAGKIVRMYKIERSESSARNRRLLLLQRYPNGRVSKDDPLYEETEELSDESEDGSEIDGTAEPATQRSKWLQSDIGRLKKALADGYDVVEIRASPFFSGRSEEAISKKIRSVEVSVLKTEKQKDSWPKDTIKAPEWTDRHSLRLHRMFREGVDEDDSRERWFRSVPKGVFQKKVRNYEMQMKRMEDSRLADSDAANAQLFELQVDERSQDVGMEPRIQEEQEVEEVKGSAQLQNTGQATPLSMNSSPPRTTKRARPPSPSVFITSSEQRAAQLRKQRQATKGKGGSKQTTLNFLRGKGKGVVGNRTSIVEIDRNFSRTSSRTTTSRKTAPPVQQGPPEQQGPILVSSGEEESDEESDGEDDEEEPEQQVDSRIDDDGFGQPGSQLREPPRPGNGEGRQTSAQSVPEDEQRIPARDLRKRLTQRDSRLTVSSSRSSKSHFDLNDRPWSAASRDGRVNSDPVIQDSVESRVAQQLTQELEQSASSANPSKTDTQEPSPSISRESVEPDESQGFQTQDPGTTFSQRRKRPQTNGLAGNRQTRQSPSSGDAESQESSTSEGEGTVEQDTGPLRVGPAATRPSPYDVGAKPSRSNGNTISRRSGKGQAPLQASGPTIISRAEPGKLPRTSSGASQLLQQRRKPRAQVSAGSTSQPQPESKPEPIVTLPYEHRPIGPNGKIEVGRLGFTNRMDPNSTFVMSDEKLYAEAAKSVGRPEYTQDMFERNKLRNEQWIAVSCRDEDEVLRLKAKERRLRRDRRKRYGLPPLPRKQKLVAGPAFQGDARAVEYHVEYLNETDSDRDDELDDVVMRLDPKRVKDPSILQDPTKLLDMFQGNEDEEEEQEEAVEPSHPNAVDFDGNVIEFDVVCAVEDADGGGDANEVDSADSVNSTDESDNTDEVDSVEIVNDATEINGADGTSNTDEEAESSGTQLSICTTRVEDDDDFGLPTAPPPEPLMDDSISVLTDGELQDLVQSGDVEMYDDDRHLIGTRRDGARSNSPVVLLSDPGNLDSAQQPDAVVSLDSADESMADETSDQHLNRQDATPNRKPASADSMVPPWPSSGKVRSSTERSGSPGKAATSEVQVPDTSQIPTQLSQALTSTQPEQAKPKKKRKDQKDPQHQKSELAEAAIERQSDETKAKKRKEHKKEQLQLDESDDVPSEVATERRRGEPKAKKKKGDRKHENVEDSGAGLATKRHSEEPKAKATKRNTANGRDHDLMAEEEVAPMSMSSKDREMMPPPPQLPLHRRPLDHQQHNRQDSFSSDASFASSTSVNGSHSGKRSRRRARIAANRRESASEQDGSIADATTSDIVTSPSAQLQPPPQESTTPRRPPKKKVSPVESSDPPVMTNPFPKQHVSSIKSSSPPRMTYHTASQASAGAQKPSGRVTPIGETQSTERSTGAKQSKAMLPAQTTQSSDDGSSSFWKVWNSVKPHIPHVPAPSDKRLSKPAKLPYSDDDEEEDSSSSSESDRD